MDRTVLELMLVWLDGFVFIILAWLILELRRCTRQLDAIGRELQKVMTVLQDLQAAVADEDTVVGQAIATLNTIPGLITAAQNSDNPDAALEALAADITTHTASLTAAQSAAATAEQPPPPAGLTLSPATVSGTAGTAFQQPLSVSGGTAPYSATGLPAGVTYDGANVNGDDTTAEGTTTATVSDSSTPPVTAELIVVIAAAPPQSGS